MGSARTERRKRNRAKNMASAQAPETPLQWEASGKSKAMGRLLQPITVDLLTPFGRWALVGERRWDKGLLRLPKLLEDAEESAAKKMTPRSLYEPQRLKAIVDALHDPQLSSGVQRDVLQQAAENVKRKLALSPPQLSRKTALCSLLARELLTSAGEPWYVKRIVAAFPYLSDGQREFSEERTSLAEAAWKRLGSPDVLEHVEREYPYAANYRVESGPDVEPYATKHRLVWAAPLSTQILEATYAVPIQLMLKGGGLTLNEARALDQAHGSIFGYMPQGILHLFMMEDFLSATTVLSLDYASFDQTISSELIELAFDALGVPRDGDGALIRSRFITKELSTPWGQKRGKFGVPSGSGFTNLVDGAVCAIASEYAILRNNWDGVYRANGDDGVLALFGSVTGARDKFVSAVAELGLRASVDKQGEARNAAMFNKAYWGPEWPGPVPSINVVANRLARHDMVTYAGPPSLDFECEIAVEKLLTAAHHPYAQDLIKAAAIPERDGVSLLDYRTRIPRLFVELKGSTLAAAAERIADIEEQMPVLPEVLYGN